MKMRKSASTSTQPMTLRRRVRIGVNKNLEKGGAVDVAGRSEIHEENSVRIQSSPHQAGNGNGRAIIGASEGPSMVSDSRGSIRSRTRRGHRAPPTKKRNRLELLVEEEVAVGTRRSLRLSGRSSIRSGTETENEADNSMMTSAPVRVSFGGLPNVISSPESARSNLGPKKQSFFSSFISSKPATITSKEKTLRGRSRSRTKQSATTKSVGLDVSKSKSPDITDLTPRNLQIIGSAGTSRSIESQSRTHNDGSYSDQNQPEWNSSSYLSPEVGLCRQPEGPGPEGSSECSTKPGDADSSQPEGPTPSSSECSTIPESSVQSPEPEQVRTTTPVKSKKRRKKTRARAVANLTGEMKSKNYAANLDKLCYEEFFNWFLPKAANLSSPAQRLLANTLSRDNVFIMLTNEMQRIQRNQYLMKTKSTDEIFSMVLAKIQNVVENELQELNLMYQELLGGLVSAQDNSS